MKRYDYIIVILLILNWGAGYLYLLFPSGVEIHPFIYSDKVIHFHWYVWLLSTNLQMCVFTIVTLIVIRFKTYWITNEIVIISAIIVIFELIWFIFYYNNPFHVPGAIIKVLAIAVIYLSIFSVRYAKHNNIISIGGHIRRSD